MQGRVLDRVSILRRNTHQIIGVPSPNTVTVKSPRKVPLSYAYIYIYSVYIYIFMHTHYGLWEGFPKRTSRDPDAFD